MAPSEVLSKPSAVAGQGHEPECCRTIGRLRRAGEGSMRRWCSAVQDESIGLLNGKMALFRQSDSLMGYGTSYDQ